LARLRITNRPQPQVSLLSLLSPSSLRPYNRFPRALIMWERREWQCSQAGSISYPLSEERQDKVRGDSECVSVGARLSDYSMCDCMMQGQSRKLTYSRTGAEMRQLAGMSFLCSGASLQPPKTFFIWSRSKSGRSGSPEAGMVRSLEWSSDWSLTVITRSSVTGEGSVA